jgi:major membrane immunogen (membrane-anchored lipoprotein)
MKKLILTFSVTGILILLGFTFIPKKNPYIDGVYKAKSQAQYTYEPYVGYITITIKNGRLIDADFKIVDTAKNELFDERYEKYFEGNQHYIDQCRSDLKGVKAYPDILSKVNDIDKVDAITGATWSYNIFKDAVNKALIMARRDS